MSFTIKFLTLLCTLGFLGIARAETLTSPSTSVWTGSGHYHSNSTRAEIIQQRDGRYAVRVFMFFLPEGHNSSYYREVGEFTLTSGTLLNQGGVIYWPGANGQMTLVAMPERSPYWGKSTWWPVNPNVVRIAVAQEGRTERYRISVVFQRP